MFLYVSLWVVFSAGKPLVGALVPYAQVVSWYVKCPLHHSHRSCLKSMQENQGGKDVVIRKLLFWVASGHLVMYLVYDFVQSCQDRMLTENNHI